QGFVGDEGVLHLEARNVLPAPPHVILFSVDEVKKALFIEFADVAAMQPHVAHDLVRLFGTAPVPLKHDVRPAWSAHYLTSYPHRELVVVLVENPDIEIGCTLAG